MDQRGFPRPAGSAADIGAFEYGSIMPSLVISQTSGMMLQIVAAGNTGPVCRLLSSTDLLQWTPMATNRISSTGAFVFHDTPAPSEGPGTAATRRPIR